MKTEVALRPGKKVLGGIYAAKKLLYAVPFVGEKRRSASVHFQLKGLVK
jgi:hypothetical protein